MVAKTLPPASTASTFTKAPSSYHVERTKHSGAFDNNYATGMKKDQIDPHNYGNLKDLNFLEAYAQFAIAYEAALDLKNKNYYDLTQAELDALKAKLDNDQDLKKKAQLAWDSYSATDQILYEGPAQLVYSIAMGQAHQNLSAQDLHDRFESIRQQTPGFKTQGWQEFTQVCKGNKYKDVVNVVYIEAERLENGNVNAKLFGHKRNIKDEVTRNVLLYEDNLVEVKDQQEFERRKKAGERVFFMEKIPLANGGETHIFRVSYGTQNQDEFESSCRNTMTLIRRDLKFKMGSPGQIFDNIDNPLTKDNVELWDNAAENELLASIPDLNSDPAVYQEFKHRMRRFNFENGYQVDTANNKVTVSCFDNPDKKKKAEWKEYYRDVCRKTALEVLNLAKVNDGVLDSKGFKQPLFCAENRVYQLDTASFPTDPNNPDALTNKIKKIETLAKQHNYSVKKTMNNDGYLQRIEVFDQSQVATKKRVDVFSDTLANLQNRFPSTLGQQDFLDTIAYCAVKEGYSYVLRQSNPDDPNTTTVTVSKKLNTTDNQALNEFNELLKNTIDDITNKPEARDKMHVLQDNLVSYEKVVNSQVEADALIQIATSQNYICATTQLANGQIRVQIDSDAFSHVSLLEQRLTVLLQQKQVMTDKQQTFERAVEGTLPKAELNISDIENTLISSFNIEENSYDTPATADIVLNVIQHIAAEKNYQIRIIPNQNGGRDLTVACDNQDEFRAEVEQYFEEHFMDECESAYIKKTGTYKLKVTSQDDVDTLSFIATNQGHNIVITSKPKHNSTSNDIFEVEIYSSRLADKILKDQIDQLRSTNQTVLVDQTSIQTLTTKCKTVGAGQAEHAALANTLDGISGGEPYAVSFEVSTDARGQEHINHTNATAPHNQVKSNDAAATQATVARTLSRYNPALGSQSSITQTAAGGTLSKPTTIVPPPPAPKNNNFPYQP